MEHASVTHLWATKISGNRATDQDQNSIITDHFFLNWLSWTSKAIVEIRSIQISNTHSSVRQAANHCEKHASTFKMVLAKSGYMPISVRRRYGFIYTEIQKSETTRKKYFYFTHSTHFGFNATYIIYIYIYISIITVTFLHYQHNNLRWKMFTFLSITAALKLHEYNLHDLKVLF